MADPIEYGNFFHILFNLLKVSFDYDNYFSWLFLHHGDAVFDSFLEDNNTIMTLTT